MKTKIFLLFLLMAQFAFSICSCPLVALTECHLESPNPVDAWHKYATKDSNAYALFNRLKTRIGAANEPLFLQYTSEENTYSKSSFLLTEKILDAKKDANLRLRFERFIQTEMNLSLRSKKKHWVFDQLDFEFKMNRHRNKNVFFTATIKML